MDARLSGPVAKRRDLSAAAPKPRLDNIDLLRAIAIVAVLLYHYTARFPPSFYGADRMPMTFPWGRHGVDLFFAVSGFCIFMTLDSSRCLENFWSRRFARIQPAYVVAICITFAVVSLAGLPGREAGPLVALSNMAWVNVIPTWPNIDSAYWSLVVELKFYLFIGLIYYAARGRNIALSWLAFTVPGIALAQFDGLPHQIGTLILIGPFAPFFLAGLLAWEWPRLSSAHRFWIGAATCLLLLATPRFDDYPGGGLLIGAAAFVVLRMDWLRVPKAITFVGLVSYSLYLLHQNIGYVIIRALPFGIELRIAIACFATLAFAAILYWTVERRWERLVQRHAEQFLARCRNSVRLQKRPIFHPTLEEEMRAW